MSRTNLPLVVRFMVRVKICILFLSSPGLFSDSGIPSSNRVLLYASFARNLQPEINVLNIPIQWSGSVAATPSEGVDGNGALRLGIDGYGTIDNRVIHADEGTVAFWYRPVGDPFGGSHTYLSWSWDQKFTEGKTISKHYAVLSQGWWEGGGHAGVTMMMLINPVRVDYANPPTQDLWEHFAFTWKRSSNRSFEISGFRNGRSELNATSDKKQFKEELYKYKEKTFMADSPVYFGCDKGTPLQGQRFADGFFNDLIFYDTALSAKEIDALFLRKAPATILRDRESPLSWMDDAVKKPFREKRNAEGVLLEGRIMFMAGNLIHLSPQKQVASSLDRVKNSGFNALMPLVYAKGVALCKSDSMKPGDRWLQIQSEYSNGKDAYQYFIDEAHRRGIEVHSAFSVTRLGPPEYLASEKSIWINGYNPKFREYIVDAVIDHVKRYDVDGINLDYIRIMDGLQCPETEKEYRRLYGRSLADDEKDEVRMTEFTSRCVEDIVERVSVGVRKIRPAIVISVCAKAQTANQGLARIGRNPLVWLNKGLIDFAVNMDYGQRLSVELFDKTLADTKRSGAWIEGLGNYDTENGKDVSRSPEKFAELVDYVRRKYGNGVFTYWYSYFSDEQITALRNGPFKELAKPHWSRVTDAK